MSTGSLAYRRNTTDIWNGTVPQKYLRILPYITGRSILEIGAAEGVQALAIADATGAHVTALEMSTDRHNSATLLQERWRSLGKRTSTCSMICGDIRHRLDLLEGIDTLVAIRTVYHLGEAIPDVFAAVGAVVPNVVLGGNPNRAKWYATRSIPETDSAGPCNYYAGVDGMVDLLRTSGYTIGTIVREGDPIVCGHR